MLSPILLFGGGPGRDSVLSQLALHEDLEAEKAVPAGRDAFNNLFVLDCRDGGSAHFIDQEHAVRVANGLKAAWLFRRTHVSSGRNAGDAPSVNHPNGA